MNEPVQIALNVPRRTLTGISFTDGSFEDLQEWLDGLPSDVEEASRRLRNGLMELNRAQSYFSARFPELELLRPRIRSLCDRLSDSTEHQKLAQSLEMELATGYQVAVVETIEERVPLEAGGHRDSPTAMAVTSIQRAIAGMGQCLLRALRRGVPLPGDFWEELYQLYILAESGGVLEEAVDDSENRLRGRVRVVDAWLRVVLLAAVDPNALRLRQLTQLHDALQDWTRFVSVRREAVADSAGVFVDLDGDGPPERALQLDDGESDALRYLDTRELCAALQRALAGDARGADAPTLPAAGGRDVAQYVLRIWNNDSERGTDRRDAQGQLALVVGMGAAHQHMRGTVDPKVAQPALRILAANVVDRSPGGLGLTLPTPVPERLQVGELVVIRPPRDRGWQLAVIRWRSLGADLCRLGIELLSPHAEAAAGRLESGEADLTVKWSPVLFIPDIPALRRPAALIVPRGRFSAGDVLTLRRATGSSQVKLGRPRSFAESYEEFPFMASEGAS